jgi:hypothetical protein
MEAIQKRWETVGPKRYSWVYRWRFVCPPCPSFLLCPFISQGADDSVQKFLNMDIATGGIGEIVLKGGSVHEQVTRFGVDGKAEAASKGDVARVLEAAAGFH